MPPIADEPGEALHRLEERLSRASEAAERLMAEAAKASIRGRPPAAGWQQAQTGDGDDAERRPSELETLIQAIAAVRDLIPPDVLERLVAALREVLLAIRALLDLSLERLELRSGQDGRSPNARGGGSPGGLEDIPIQ